MVEHAHEHDEVERLITHEIVDVIDVDALEDHVQAELLTRKARLIEVNGIVIDTQHATGSAALHLKTVEAGVAADVEHRLAAQVVGYCLFEEPPEVCGKVTQWVVWSGLYFLLLVTQPQ